VSVPEISREEEERIRVAAAYDSISQRRASKNLVAQIYIGMA